MEAIIEQMPKTESGFIQHMTRFDNNTKSDLMNVAQYSLLSVIPLVLVNKVIGRFVPETDETKGSLEITAEVVGQLVVLLFSLYFINRLVTYIKPYSGAQYTEVNMITLSLVLLVVVFSFQTQLAEKIEILYGRVVELWTGEPYGEQKEEQQQETRVRVTQPLAPSMPTHQQSRADYLGAHNQMVGNNEPSVSMANARYESTLISDLPPSPPQVVQQQAPPSAPIQPLQQPNFDSMYQEPMAANEGFGGFASF